MANRALKFYYASMITFLAGAIFVVLLGAVIQPVVMLYHENTRSMISPIFGNFYNFLLGLFYIGLALTTLSAILYVLSFVEARRSKLRMSMITLLFPLVLYVFSYALLVVSFK